MIRGKHAVAGLFVVASAGLLGMACAKNESSIYVHDVKQLQPGTCTSTPDELAPSWSQGVLDVALAKEYYALLLVGNQLVQRGADPTQLRTETSKVELYSTDVQVLDENGNVYSYADATGTHTSEFSSPGSGFIDPSLGGISLFGLIGATLIDYGTAQDLVAYTSQPTRPERALVASLIVHGRTLGGNELTTAAFTFPIRVCYGCLVTFPPEAVDPSKKPAVNCQNTQATTAGVTACLIGQDVAVPCTACRQTNPSVCDPR
jgi:hypothetical protein